MSASRTNPEHLDRRFRKNMGFLHDSLKQRVLQVDIEEVWERIDIVYSNEGDPICRYKENGTFVHINSIDPINQAKQWCNRIPLDDISTLFIYGCGFGYPLYEILQKKESNTLVFVFEPDRHLFVALLHYFDLEPLVQTHKFAFFIGDLEESVKEFQDLLLDALFGCTSPYAVFTPDSRRSKQQYLEIHDRLFEKMEYQISRIGNDHYDTLLGFQNIIDNRNEVLENPYFSSLKDKYANVPAFIIANGPSLDKNLDELKKIQGKGLILCSESAIIPLMKNNIKPDAICVLERTPENFLYHFENKQYPQDIALLANTVADPRIFTSFSGPRIPIFHNKDSNSNFINFQIGDGSSINGGISVAHFAYDIAFYMGANPIVLVGQDLAYGPDGVTHSKQSLYAEEQQKHVVEEIKSQPEIYVESNDGKIIPTNVTWYHFKLIFEQMIEQNPQITVINTTEGGAKINGTRCDKLVDVIKTYCKDLLPYGLHTLIDENKQRLDLPARKIKMQKLSIELEKYVAIYRALDQLTSQIRAKCGQVLDLPEQQDLSDVQEQLNRHFLEINKFLDPYVHTVFFQQVILVGYHRINVLGSINTSNKLFEAMKILFELCDYLNIICKSLVRNFHIANGKISSKGT